MRADVRAKLGATRLGFSNWNLELPAPSCFGDVLGPAQSLASGSGMSGWVESAAFISCSKCFLERQRKEETRNIKMLKNKYVFLKDVKE